MQIFPVNRFGVSLEIYKQIVENRSTMIKLYHVMQTLIIKFKAAVRPPFFLDPFTAFLTLSIHLYSTPTTNPAIKIFMIRLTN